MSVKEKILLIGSSSMELSVASDELPAPGETKTEDGNVAYWPEGNRMYLIATLSKLGADVSLCSKLGVDFHGQRLFDLYKSVGLNTACLTVDREQPTGMTVRLQEAGKEPRTLLYPGANAGLSVDNVLDAVRTFDPRSIVIDFTLPEVLLRSTVKLASEAGIPVFLSGEGWNSDICTEDLPPVEILVLSAKEAADMSGVQPGGVSASLQAASRIARAIPCRHLVINLGARGVFLYHGTRYNQISPFSNIKSTPDMIGLDSLFYAALALGHTSDPAKLENSIAFASACVSYAALHGGKTTDFPTAQDMAAFLAAQDT